MVRKLAGLIWPGAPAVEAANALTDAAIVPLLGGLVAVADWIGSDQKHYPPRGASDPVQYALESARRAPEALRSIGWLPRPRYAVPAAFTAIFRHHDGSAYEPNQVQATAIKLIDEASAPYLMIVEAAMGGGKTEIALYGADRALGSGYASGLYIAMPTQATGDAMFHRVYKDYLLRRGHGGGLNYQLVHGGALLSEAFEKLKVSSSGEDNPSGDGRVVVEEWFTPKKQALLAPLGAGTIDQSLFGALQTRHWFVRLFGLAGKVVVFDEVHSYDVYMSGLLYRLLGWLRMLNCTVILLSATLPAGRRAALLEAWGAEAGKPTDYPRITIADTRRTLAVTAGSGGPTRGLVVDWAPGDLKSLPGRLLGDLPNGGCAAIICNTVGRAQEAYRLMRAQLRGKGWLVMLLHGRIPARWRRRREARLLRFLGKSGKRPERLVVVGTQLLEQSLDYDVDWMASEMAPGDLLLQRAGRLWRHPREQRPASGARFVILCDVGPDELPVFPHGTAREGRRGGVYERYCLLRSYLALRDLAGVQSSGRLELPQKIEPLVSATYGDLLPEGLSAAWMTALHAAREDAEREAREDAVRAEQVVTPDPRQGLRAVLEPGATLENQHRTLFDDEDPRVHETVRAATRLGEPRVQVICAGITAGGLPLAPLPHGEIQLAEAREMLGYSVAVSQRGLYWALVAQDPPSNWKQDRHLRYHRLVVFAEGQATVGRYVLRLSRAEGLAVDASADE